MPIPRVQTHLLSLKMAHDFLMKALHMSATEPQLLYQVGESKAHTLWLLGHLVWTYDAIYASAFGLPPELPARFHQCFAAGLTPSASAGDYPSLSEIAEAGRTSFARVSARIATLTEADLAAPLPVGHPLGKFFPTIDAFLALGAIHTGYHIGQVSLLRRAQGLSSVLGA